MLGCINCLALLCNAKGAASFYFGRWNTGTNPDLAFASVGPNSCLPDRRVLEKFPRSQNRPSPITSPRLAMAVPSMPVKRWNFRKAKWSHYIALTNKFAKTLLPPDSLDVDAAYQDFCNTIKKAAKKTIPRGYRNNYIPCWDAECESLYKTFLQSPQGDDSSLAATALLAKLDRKRRDRWSEAVRSIDFSHSFFTSLFSHSRHSVVSLGKTLYGTFPAWWFWQAVLNYNHISIKLQADSNILVSPEAGRGNCLPYVQGAFNKFPDFFGMDTFINRTHKKL